MEWLIKRSKFSTNQSTKVKIEVFEIVSSFLGTIDQGADKVCHGIEFEVERPESPDDHSYITSLMTTTPYWSLIREDIFV